LSNVTDSYLPMNTLTGFKPLFEELNTRGIPLFRLNPAAHQFAIEAART